MFTHVLVPLDGSQLAEAALPAAVAMAGLLSAAVTLVHVIEKNAPREIHGQPHLRNPEEAETYLHEIAAQTFPADIKINYHVHTAAVEDVAASIAGHIGELGGDLVIMSTHGHGGLRDLFFGNIAQQVIALGKTPVLMIPTKKVEDNVSSPFHCRQMLVPLDGKAEHEIGLVKIEAFAKTCGASLHLLMVVPTIETLPGKMTARRRMMPGATTVLLDMEVQEGEQYLLKVRGKLEGIGFIVRTEVLRGEPAALIAETAQRIQADLIVLGTHARRGMEAFWAESMTPKIYKQCKIPLLFVPVQ